MEASVFQSPIIYNNGYDPSVSFSINTLLIDNISNPNIFNSFLLYEKELKKYYYLKKITDAYDFRPDRIALEEYNNQLLYPIILIGNDLCSMFQFRVKNLEYQVKIPNKDLVTSILAKLNN